MTTKILTASLPRVLGDSSCVNLQAFATRKNEFAKLLLASQLNFVDGHGHCQDHAHVTVQYAHPTHSTTCLTLHPNGRNARKFA
mgnify:CR=1 FL=1